MPLEVGDEAVADDGLELLVLIVGLCQARGDWAHQAIGEEDAQEGAKLR